MLITILKMAEEKWKPHNLKGKANREKSLLAFLLGIFLALSLHLIVTKHHTKIVFFIVKRYIFLYLNKIYIDKR